LLGLVLATAETSLIEPLGICFAAMPNKRTPQERVGTEKLETASAKETTPRLFIEARKRATKDPTANHLLSDDRESKDNS
jgi:hypothetical protein